jgi:hypothetical protein
MTDYRSTTTLDEPAIDVANGAESTHPLAEAGRDAGESVGRLAERATDIGIRQADRGRQQAANGIENVAQTIRRVSTVMQVEQPQIANVALGAADQAERIAQYLRETDARQLIGNVEDVARRQPLIFLGGAFLLGMAASRFIKAAGGSGGAQGQGQTGVRSGTTAYGTFPTGTSEGI